MDVTLAIIEIILALGFIAISGRIKKYPSNKWRLLYIAPGLLTIIIMSFIPWNIGVIGLYIAPVIMAMGLFSENDKVKRCIAGGAAAVALLTLINISINPGYNRLDLYGDFEEVFASMKKHYILTEEKGIDWDKLYKEYKPKFKEADKKQDLTMNYQIWQQYAQEFYDGHVGYTPNKLNENQALSVMCESYGNDYGLSLIKLSTGEYAAVNVEGCGMSYSINDKDDIGEVEYSKIKDEYKTENADAERLTLVNAGIKNGTIITKWDGKAIDDYFDDIPFYYFQVPVKENEEFYQPMYVAGMGGDSVEISFLDESGEEKTVTAPKLGAYAPRLDNTITSIDKGVKMTNLTWESLSEDTVMIRIYSMAYDMNTYDGADYSEMTNKLREEVLAYKEAGIKNIVFDLRSNSGGSPFMVQGVAQLFAPEGEHSTYYSAEINEDTATFERGADGKYKMGEEAVSYYGEDLWHDGQIILLVNAQTVSAGDDMVYMMGDFPNVKVMGTTKSNNSCQAVQGMEISTGQFAFSVVPNLTEDGEIAIDTLTDHESRVPFDEYIPMDEELITAIFDNGEDYILKYAAESF
ncbi:MAG: hypothetical protein IJ749_06105 [Eubacterium sp.]|nr:hypothetical protein [Eubacterium sp.]